MENIGDLKRRGIAYETGLALQENLVLPLSEHRAVITKEFFDRCTYIVEGNQTGEIALEDPKGRRIVTVSFDAPLFGIWSPEGKNAPFLCIEPWYGRCDSLDFEGTLSERAYTNTLEKGAVFERSYQMLFGEPD